MWKYSISSLTFLFLLLRVECLSPVVTSVGCRRNCTTKESTLAVIDIAKDVVSKVYYHYNNFAECPTYASKPSTCQDREKALFYIDTNIELMNQVRESIYFGPKIQFKKPHAKPMDCSDVQENGHNVSGIYTIWPRSELNTSLDVVCDMDTDQGGWTLVQRRDNFYPNQDFYLTWKEYKAGFGDLRRSFWIGNDNLHILSNQAAYKIRFDLRDVEGNTAYAAYHLFRVEDDKNNYRIHIEKFRGTSGDSMNHHNNKFFSTKDADHDENGGESVAQKYNGGWWYGNDYRCNLNGVYKPGVKGSETSVRWNQWKGDECLAGVEMKIKRV